jgi:hypothetical protein
MKTEAQWRRTYEAQLRRRTAKRYGIIPIPEALAECVEDQRLLRAFMAALRGDDAKAASKVFAALANRGDRVLLRRALRPAACRVAGPRVREWFLATWIDSGNSIRDAVGRDLVLTDVLHALLLPYAGPPVVLYRGESLWNRRRCTYGPSWTASREVAEFFAQQGMYRIYTGGSELLHTEAPATAIICHVDPHGEFNEQEEFLVDRRHLGRVEGLTHYPQITHEQLRVRSSEA